jgi:hypothetical protein
METHCGNLTTDIMLKFPSESAAATFPEWVANHVGLEQLLGLAGFLDPDFYEVKGHLFWDRRIGERAGQIALVTPFGNDAATVERYFNTLNLAEFFLLAADEAVHRVELVEAFGRVLQHFWSMALKTRFPKRTYRFEIASDVFNEEGLCLTFWQERGP